MSTFLYAFLILDPSLKKLYDRALCRTLSNCYCCFSSICQAGLLLFTMSWWHLEQWFPNFSASGPKRNWTFPTNGSRSCVWQIMIWSTEWIHSLFWCFRYWKSMDDFVKSKLTEWQLPGLIERFRGKMTISMPSFYGYCAMAALIPVIDCI